MKTWIIIFIWDIFCLVMPGGSGGGGSNPLVFFLLTPTWKWFTLQLTLWTKKGWKGKFSPIRHFLHSCFEFFFVHKLVGYQNRVKRLWGSFPNSFFFWKFGCLSWYVQILRPFLRPRIIQTVCSTTKKFVEDLSRELWLRSSNGLLA